MREINVVITNQKALEIGYVKKDSLDITLGGLTPLLQHNSLIKSECDSGNLCPEKNTFNHIFGQSKDFFYLVQLIDKNKGPILTEVGVGNIIGDKLNREYPLFYSSSKIPQTITTNKQNFYYSDENKYIILTNYNPSTLNELSVQTNSIIATSEHPSIPTAIKLEENSLVARKDGPIGCYSLDSISEDARNYICSYTKQLILKSSQMNVRKVKTKQLVLDPINFSSADAKNGTIFHDKDHNGLVFYDGKKWHKVVTKEL